MKKINKTKLPETSNPEGGQDEITDTTNSQLIKILPIKLKKGDFIGKEFPGIKGFVTKVLGKKKVSHNDLTHVETSEGKDFYLYPDGSPVYIKDYRGKDTQDLVPTNFQTANFKGREVSIGSPVFYTDTFKLIQNKDDINQTSTVYSIHEKLLGERKCLKIWTNAKALRDYLVDQETGEILRVEGRTILSIDDDKKVKIKDRIVQSVDLNTGIKKSIYTDTLKEVKIQGIEDNIKKISLGNYNMYDTYLGPYQIMFAETDTGKKYIFDINTMKILKFPGVIFDIDAEKIINKRFDSDSYASEIVGDEFNIFQKEIFSIPFIIPNIKEKHRSTNISIYKETGLPVKIPGTDLFVCGFDEVYTPDRAKVINGERYGEAVILDTEEGRNSAIYLREGDLSILEARLLNGEKVMINDILDEESRTLNIDGKEIIPAFINKSTESILIDNQTFQEVIIKVSGTDEEINLIWHHVLNIGGEEIIQVGTKSGKNIYIYKKNLAPLQISGIPGYVEDIKKLEDDKWNMKINGKWNLVRVK